MTRRLHCTAAALAAATLCTTSFAAGPIPSFDKLDANDDGYVTLAEAGADTRISRNFEAADRDGDYRLDREEYREAARKAP